MNAELKTILMDMFKKQASDLHITANACMHYRVHHSLIDVSSKVLTGKDVKDIVYTLMNAEQTERFEKDKELDFSFAIEDYARFRANVFYQRNSVGCAIRIIPYEMRSIADCGLPEDVIKKFCALPKGMVLVTGATGSGKSTTLAAMIDEINRNRACHIITVEDPIEFVHKNKKAVIDQREVLSDTHTFSDALKHVLRQAPDVILIGELRDLESMQEAMIIADTGHLVFATLHTSDSVQTINRMIDVFPSHQQRQIRAQLSFVLQGIISQQLVPKAEQDGMTLATEILVITPPIRNMIRDEKVHQIYSSIQTSQKLGMRTMNQSLSDLYMKGAITRDDAFARSMDPEELSKLLGMK